MPLVIRALTYPDGTTPADTKLVYVIGGSGSAGYFCFPDMPWDTLEIRVNAVSIPDRDFANIDAQPVRSQLAELVDRNFVSVWDTTALPFPKYLTGDEIRDYS